MSFLLHVTAESLFEDQFDVHVEYSRAISGSRDHTGQVTTTLRRRLAWEAVEADFYRHRLLTAINLLRRVLPLKRRPITLYS